ncbi:E3 ubiquitin-protein ligase sh3rf3 [Mactra antiquata]
MGPSRYLSMSDIHIDSNEVLKLLNGLNPDKMSGPYGVNASILKECSSELAEISSIIFNLSPRTGYCLMDEKALNELLECSVCLDQLDDTSKVLPCQHTFCRRCLEEIVSTKHELRCPECRFLVEMRVDELPTNILLIRLLEGLKSQSRATGSQVSGCKKEGIGSPGAGKGDNSNQAVAAFARQQQQRQASNSSRPCAKALFNYDAKDPSDLSFKKGDVVYLKKRVDENWFNGELNGQHGFFPATYVQVITPLPDTIPQCKGLYEFNVEDDKEGDCLPFKKDDVMTVIRKVDENWLEVKKGDKIGILPISFVSLNEPAKVLLSLTDKTSARSLENGPPVTPAHPVRATKEGSPSTVINKRHSLTTISPTIATSSTSIQRRSLDSSTDPDLLVIGGKSVAMLLGQGHSIPSFSVKNQLPVAITTIQPISTITKHVSASSMPGMIPSINSESEIPCVPSMNKPECQISVEQQQPSSTSSSLNHRSDISIPSVSGACNDDNTGVNNGPTTTIYVALFNYKPQKGDELELHKGEYYTVSEKCLDGWYKGVSIKTDVAGVFPGNYVQKRVSPNGSQKSSSSKPHGVKHKHSSVNMGSQTGSGSQPVVSPPRPKTSSSEAIMGRSRSRDGNESRSGSGDRNGAPPPIVPRSSQTMPSGKGHSSSSSPNSPILTTPKTTRYVRASKSTSPNVSVKSESTSTSNASPIWKHSLSASANITPPNVVYGASANTTTTSTVHNKDKEKKKDKEKLSLMKRITSAASGNKSKKPKSSDVETTLHTETSVSHSRSGSYPSDGASLVTTETSHKKSGSFDSSSPSMQHKPARPKPLPREKYRCVDTYPAQSEIELDLKVGDIIYVHKKRDDGWYKGTLQRSGKTGLFPGSFVQKCS